MREILIRANISLDVSPWTFEVRASTRAFRIGNTRKADDDEDVVVMLPPVDTIKSGAMIKKGTIWLDMSKFLMWTPSLQNARQVCCEGIT